MSKSKLKILVCSEASFIKSGFGVYTKELLTRLHATNKYEIAEFASYGFVNDPRDVSIPWKYYANAVKEGDPRHKEYSSRTDNQFGRWRFEKVLLDFRPDMVCVPPSTLIHTENGYRPICDIKVGDKVMSHKGVYRKVLKTMRRQHVGKMVRIRANGDTRALRLTEEHPVLVYKKRSQTNQKKSISKMYAGQKPEFVPAKDVKRGDLLVLPTNKESTSYKTINITDYIDNFLLVDNKIIPVGQTNCNSVNAKCKVDYDFGVLIGYIIGDGCIYDTSISITFNIHEKDFAEDSVRLLSEKFGLPAKIRTDETKHCLSVTCHSVILAEFLSKIIGTKENKKIPNVCWHSPKLTKQGLIRGLFRSDGCYKKNTVSFTSKMKHLAYELRQLCVDVGIPVSINSKYTIVHNVEGYGESAKLLHDIVEKNSEDKLRLCVNSVRRPRNTHMINGHMVASVKYTKTDSYSGQVYNLEVEKDNSYVANWCVHNCDVRDFWMSSYQKVSPLRSYFHWILMPTVDSAPQQEEWIDTFLNADAIFTYSDWGADVLKEQSSGKINYIDTVSPGVDPNIFKIKNQSQLRKHFGLAPDTLIVGSVMRNQKRKLIPELFASFRIVLDQLRTQDQHDTADKLFLYLHTSYPDMGWDIPELLRHYRVTNKVLFTYFCKNCNHVTCNKFVGPQKTCPKCLNKTASLPSVSNGVSTEQLSDIYNLFDLYIQYSLCEGFGIPIVEAGACGVPLAVVNYSAMCDMVNKLEAYPIKVKSYFKELETRAIRVYPDNDDLANYIMKFIMQPKPLRDKQRQKVSELTHKYYNWDDVAKKWENYFDKLDASGYRANWGGGDFLTPVTSNIQIHNDNYFDPLMQLLNNNMRDPQLIGSQKMLELLNYADYGFVQNGNNISPFTFGNIQEYIKTFIDNHNQAKQAKDNNIKFDEDFITYAHLKNQS